MRVLRDVMVVGVVAAMIVPVVATQPAAGHGADGPTSIERVSVSSSEAQADRSSGEPAVSADGRYIAFGSSASNLVRGDTNGVADIFVRDRWTGATERASVSSAGGQANGPSEHTAISADGRHVAFLSSASNFVPGDTGEHEAQVFVRDRRTGRTTRVSVTDTGAPASSESGSVAISADGRYVAFYSFAANLVPDDTNNDADVFVHDRATRRTTRVSVSSTGVQSDSQSLTPSLSSDGRYVAFQSFASTLTPGDTNRSEDVFVRDQWTRTTSRVSVSTAGVEADDSSAGPAITPNGRYVTFSSYASNLVADDTSGAMDVFVHDRWTGVTSRASVSSTGTQAGYGAGSSTISADGRYVAFTSYSDNLTPGDTNDTADVFLRDRWAGVTTLISLADGPADSHSGDAVISADGRVVAFTSVASDLVPRDTNATQDVFIRRIR